MCVMRARDAYDGIHARFGIISPDFLPIGLMAIYGCEAAYWGFMMTFAIYVYEDEK